MKKMAAQPFIEQKFESLTMGYPFDGPERWYKIVGSGDEKHLRTGTQIGRIQSKGYLYGYLSRYIKKLDQKISPARIISLYFQQLNVMYFYA